MDQWGVVDVFVRTVATFAVLLIMTRILGKKQMGQLTLFNYITGITIGSVAASFTVDRRILWYEGLTSLTTWIILVIAVGWITLKSRKTRKLFEGEPTIIIKNGKILEKTLSDFRMSMDHITMLLREKDIFELQDIEYAIMETNGKITVLKKAEMETVRRKDLGIKPNEIKYVPTVVVQNKKILNSNLRELNVDENWLLQQLNQRNLSLDQINFAQIKSDGSLIVDVFDDRAH
jgi:uncharacterized membrane protein YcaP (DUF421 family)